MNIEIILYGVIAFVLVLDFALKGVKKKNTQNDIERIGEEQSKKKALNLNYLLKRKRNILTFILLVILCKPITHYLFFTESERKYDYQTKVDYQPYMKVYHKLDKSYPLNNDLKKRSISERINNTKYIFDNDLYFSAGNLENFVSSLSYALDDRYDINQLDPTYSDVRLDKLLEVLTIYEKNKKLYFESIDSLLVDQSLAEILFPKNLYDWYLQRDTGYKYFYAAIGLAKAEDYDSKSGTFKEIEVEYAFKAPKKLKVSPSTDYGVFPPWLSRNGKIIDWQQISIVDIYKTIYRARERHIYNGMFHINNIFTEAGEKIITNDYNTIYSDWNLYQKKITKGIDGIPFKSSAKFYYHPFKYEIKSLSWHIEKVFKSKLWLFVVSFASLGVLVLLFNDKIKAR